MRRWLFGLVGAACLAPSGLAAQAVDDKYHITAAEKIACTRDAMRLCYETYPDEDRMIVCMKANMSSLSSVCRTAFVAGLRRRHLQ